MDSEIGNVSDRHAALNRWTATDSSYFSVFSSRSHSHLVPVLAHERPITFVLVFVPVYENNFCGQHDQSFALGYDPVIPLRDHAKLYQMTDNICDDVQARNKIIQASLVSRKSHAERKKTLLSFRRTGDFLAINFRANAINFDLVVRVDALQNWPLLRIDTALIRSYICQLYGTQTTRSPRDRAESMRVARRLVDSGR